MSDLGARMRRLRKERGLSGEDLAGLTGGVMTRNIIANLETGRTAMTVEVLVLLTGLLGVSAYELVPELDPERSERDVELQRVFDELKGALSV